MKSLVIYFSHTGENWYKNGLKYLEKGNTEVVAENISRLTGADLFKVDTEKEYSYGYYACCDEAKKEYEGNERPSLKKELHDISDYDVIYIGGPVWWGHLPMAMFSQLEKLDFTGKKVMPFCTHEGSGLGDVMKDATLLCKGAEIGKGLPIWGHNANVCEDLLKNWVL